MNKKLNKKKVLFAILLIIIVISCIMLGIYAVINNNRQQTVETISNDIITENISTTDNNVEIPKEEVLIPMYTTTGVNVRIGPALDAEIFDTIVVNSIVNKVEGGEVGDWTRIKIDTDYYYIFSKYLSTEKTMVQATSRSAATARTQQKSKPKVSQPATAQSNNGNLVGYFTLTYYCPCSQCCGKSTGITAWGTKATAGKTIATSNQFAFGTQLVINGHTYTVEDRGGAIKGNKIDIYVNSHSEALALGRKTNVPVYSK